MKKLLFYFLGSLLLLKMAVVNTGCANIVPPAGGPRDSLPPVLVRANPEARTRNFTGNRIVLTFDEFVDLDNPLQNIIVSPLLPQKANATRKLNVITVKLDSLEPNTTYRIDFGPTIKDINESNVLKNFSFTFSTGRYIDSSQFSGNIVIAETGDTDSTLTAMLFREKDDSALYYKRPRYVTKTDGKGNFTFKNLAPGTYYLYALKDEGGVYRYTSPTALFAFADSAVHVGGNTEPVTLYAYAAKPSSSSGANNNAAAVTALLSQNRARNNNPNEKKRLKFTTNMRGGQQDLLEKFMFVFENKLATYDSSKIHISTDTSYIPVTDKYSWKLDSTKKNLVLTYPWKENTKYNIIVEKDFATDTSGLQLLKKDTINFISKAASDYAKISIRFRNLDLKKNPVLQFIQANQVAASFPLASDTFTNPMFPPGEYELRILEDTNKNGVWDPGDFYGKHKQPELVRKVPRKVTIKQNWDNGFEIAL